MPPTICSSVSNSSGGEESVRASYVNASPSTKPSIVVSVWLNPAETIPYVPQELLPASDLI